MATFVEQGRTVDEGGMLFADAVVYTLTSGQNGTALTGTGDTIMVSSDAAGWVHVSTGANTDKAASGKTHRILANSQRMIGGVMKGMFISFFAEV